MHKHRATRAFSALISLVLTCVALVVLAPAAMAADPVVNLSGGASSSVLYGRELPISLTASAPAGQPFAYNLAFREVLPNGVSYVAGSAGSEAGEPLILPNSPTIGKTTLIWQNVSDLSANSSYTLSFKAAIDELVYDVGDTFQTTGGAYISDDARWEADFAADGTPVGPTPTSFSASDEETTTTQITAIEVAKSEPHPEGEIPRGLHDHQTVYTLKVTNNLVNPTNTVSLEDYVPAGLEFLGCEGVDDHTTDAPTNPGSTQEYPGSGPIEVAHPTTAEGCIEPDLVETVELDPDGAGPLPEAVYTHVKWNDIGNFSASQIKEIRYAAAIPIRENTLDWSGATPNTTGEQTANLDNNSGPETYDEQPLLNGAKVAGTYKHPSKPGLPVFDWDTLLRTAEDIAIQKSNNKGSLDQGDLTTWTLNIQVSEYRSVTDMVVHDVVPNGLCPLNPVNHTTGNSASDSECHPTGGANPSDAYTSVTEQADGTFDIYWDKTTAPWLAHLQPSASETITFKTRTRENYQQNFEDWKPILSRDDVTNNVDVKGNDWVRCVGDPDCTTSGDKIDHDEVDGELDFDVSGSGKAATGPALEKTVAADYPASGDCNDLGAADYGKTLPEYGPGDQICWKLWIAFPQKLDTKSLNVFDLLPNGIEYVPGSWQATSGNTVPIGPFTYDDGRLEWEIGDADNVDAGGKVFEVTFKSTLGSPLGHHSGDVEGNLLKFSYENTAGRSFPLRDKVDFTWKLPELSLLKGVRQINNSGPVFGPDTDHKQVQGGDTVQYRVDVTNNGTADASSSRVWDQLPADLACSDVQLGSISDGGVCNAAFDRIEWSGIPVAHATTKTLTYKVTVPANVSVSQSYVNVAGVVEFTYTTNDGDTYQLVPDNDVVKDTSLPTPNAPRAQDDSDVFTPNATVAKTRTTSVTESGNNAASQATIGETINYTVTTTVPQGTTLYDATVVDALGSRQTYVPGTLAGTLNGTPLPTGGVSVAESSNTITATFPAVYTNAAGSGDDVLVLTFSAKVLDVNTNTRSTNLPNTGTLAFKDQLGRPLSRSGSVDTTIVEPKVGTTKSHAPSGRVSPGQIVDFTVKATNSTGSNVSTAHDYTVVDTLPVGTDPVDSGGNPIADGGSVGPQNGIWNLTARTITWNKTTTAALNAIAPGGSVDLTYKIKVESPPVSGRNYVNNVDLQAKSLDGSVGGVRTSSSTASTKNDYKAAASDTLQVVLASIVKAVSPNPLTIGNKVTWTVTVTLPKNLQYYDTTVVDTVPDGFDLDSYGTTTCLSGCLGGDPAITTGGTTSGASGTLGTSWYLGDLAPSPDDRVIELKLHGHVRDTYRNGGAQVLAGQSRTNTASIKTNRTDKGTPAPTATFDDTVGPVNATSNFVEPKLTIDKSASKGPYVEGNDHITYTIAVKNTGTSPAYDVVIDDQPDSELTNVVLVSGAGFATDTWSAVDRDIRWVIPGPIAVGATVTLTYTADVKPSSALHASDTILNTANIFEYFGVPQATRTADGFVYRRYTGPNDTVTLTPDFPKLSLVKTTGGAGFPDSANVEINQPFTWRVVVTNNSHIAVANDVDVTDTLPPNWQYIPGTSTLTPGADVDPSIAPAGSGDVLTWSNVTDLAPGQSLTVTFQAKPLSASKTTPGSGPGNPHINKAVSTADDSTGASGNADGPYKSNEDTAQAILRAPDLSIVKTPDATAGGPTNAVAGTASSFTIKVTNTGAGTAHNVVIDDVLPAGLHYTAGTATATVGFTETSVAANTPGPGQTSISWKLNGSLAPSASVTFTLPVAVDASVPNNTLLVNNSKTHADDVDEKTDPGALKVETKVDVQITKVDDVDPVVPGENLTYTLAIKNNGPSDAQNVTITDNLPSPDLTFLSADAPCTNVGNAVTCSFGTLTPGATRTVHITAKVNPAQTTTIHNVANVTTTTTETNTSNNQDDEDTHVTPKADVSIVKTADDTHYLGADTITYKLVATNNGPSTAKNVTVTDPLPSAVDFVSVTPGSPTCGETSGTVNCTLGSLAPGASETITIVTKAKGDPPVPTPGLIDHQITVTRPEQHLSIQAGQTATTTLTCDNGGSMVDGSFHVTGVDQGQDLADVHVVERYSTATGSYRFVIRNDTAGQAQVKVFGLCLPANTEPSQGHQHALIVGAPVTTTSGVLPPGRHTFHLSTPAGHRAVAPGMLVQSGVAQLVRSEDDGSNGWDFTVEVPAGETAQVQLSVRGLQKTTGIGNGHRHELLFEHPTVSTTLAPGETRTIRVSCAVGYKGIVATYDLPSGVIQKGNEPQPINRDFELVNTTGSPQNVMVDLICMRITTGREIFDEDDVVNTATIATTTFDTDSGNDSSSVSVHIETAPDSVPNGGGGSGSPTPDSAGPSSDGGSSSLSSSSLSSPQVKLSSVVSFSSSASAANVSIACNASCAGTVALSIPGAKPIVIGTAKFRLRGAGKTIVKVKISRKGKAQLRKRGTRKLRLDVRVSGKKTTSQLVKLRRYR